MLNSTNDVSVFYGSETITIFFPLTVVQNAAELAVLDPSSKKLVVSSIEEMVAERILD